MTKLGLKADQLMDDRTERPVVCPRARTYEFQSHFSHEKTQHVISKEEENHDRTEKPVVCPQRGARAQQFIIGDDETELVFSLGSRSFLDRMNDQVRKRQKRSSMKSSVFSAQRSTYFQILFCVLVRYTRTPNQTLHANQDLKWFKSASEYINLDRIDGEPMVFE